MTTCKICTKNKTDHFDEICDQCAERYYWKINKHIEQEIFKIENKYSIVDISVSNLPSSLCTCTELINFVPFDWYDANKHIVLIGVCRVCGGYVIYPTEDTVEMHLKDAPPHCGIFIINKEIPKEMFN